MEEAGQRKTVNELIADKETLRSERDAARQLVREYHNKYKQWCDTVERLEQETHDQAEQIEILTKACQEMKDPSQKWWQVYQDQCEGAYVEATIVKELRSDIAKLKDAAEHWKALDRNKFDEIARLKSLTQHKVWPCTACGAINTIEQKQDERE